MWAKEQGRGRVVRKGILEFDSCYEVFNFLVDHMLNFLLLLS